jgi:hypothetical protein
MNKLLIFIFISVIAFSCKHRYSYTEVRRDGNKEEIIKAKNDTIAYNKAYQKFCISLASESVARESVPGYSNILGFKLFKSDGKIVSKPLTKAQLEKEKEIEEFIFGMLKADTIAKIKLYKFKILELQLTQ